MSKLEVNPKIISHFKGKINGEDVYDEDVYYTISELLEYLTYDNIPFTKWDEFIADLIQAFEDLKESAITDSSTYVNDYTYIESILIKDFIRTTTIDELTATISDIVENEGYTEFGDLYDKLDSNYYTS